MMMTWTESAGGPLVVAAPSLLSKWEGVGEWLPDSDYDAACAVAGYLGVLARHGGQALVLGDEPMATAFLVIEGHLVLARWMYCASKGMAEELLHAVPPQLPSLEEPRDFEQQATEVALLDSGQAGVDALSSVDRAALPAGAYRVTTEDYAGVEFRFVVHRFLRKS